MFLNLSFIIIVGIIGGLIFEKIKLPKLVFYLVLGILMSPSAFNLMNNELLNYSSNLRQIALIIILTRSGLSLNLNNLKKIGRPAILMCFIPATFEIIGIFIVGPWLLNINHFEALLLGSVLAAVSPAVIVPRMIKMQQEGKAIEHHLPELVMAGASCDDIYVIVLFYAFKDLVKNNNVNGLEFLSIPVSIVLGIIFGILMGLLLVLIFKKTKINTTLQIILTLGFSFFMVGIETQVKKYIPISSLIGVIVLGIIVLKILPNKAKEIESGYKKLWNFFEIILFVLVGCIINLDYALSNDGVLILLTLLIGLIFRTLGVIICLIKTKFTKKEYIFIIISYLPKATVQASIGGIALAEGLSCGEVIVTAAIFSILITAPIGAIVMDSLSNKWFESHLEHDYIE